MFWAVSPTGVNDAISLFLPGTRFGQYLGDLTLKGFGQHSGRSGAQCSVSGCAGREGEIHANGNGGVCTKQECGDFTEFSLDLAPCCGDNRYIDAKVCIVPQHLWSPASIRGNVA